MNNELPYFTVEDVKTKEFFKVRLQNNQLICLTCVDQRCACSHLINLVENKDFINNKKIKKFIGITQKVIDDVYERKDNVMM